MKVRFGVGLPRGMGPAELPGVVDRLEAAGVDSLWFSELVYSPLVEPFVGMAHALARTAKLKVGTGVAILPGRHPALVAKQLASLAALAPKRVLPVFGLEPANPAERSLFPVPDGRRGAVFDESLGLLRALLERPGMDFDGRFHSVRSATIEPGPTRRSTSGSAAARPAPSAGPAASPTAGWAASSRPRRPAGRGRQSRRRPPRPDARSRPTTTASA